VGRLPDELQREFHGARIGLDVGDAPSQDLQREQLGFALLKRANTSGA
jgi:hypothetical protein